MLSDIRQHVNKMILKKLSCKLLTKIDELKEWFHRNGLPDEN